MTGPRRLPGTVIFVAVLNFVLAFLSFSVAGVWGALLLFGRMMRIQHGAAARMDQVIPEVDWLFGLNVLFILMFVTGVLFFLYFLVLGMGLLRGKALAWYFEIATCILGLFLVPLGTALSIVILVLFFQGPIRDFFNI